MKTNAILIAAMVLISNAAIPQSNAKPLRRYVVTDYGAVADGKTVNTKAIQAAIDKCASSGGGVIVIPKGTFLSGAIFLKQGVNLLVEKDGVLKGTTNIDDYPVIQTRWEGTEEPWTSAFINAEGVIGLEISGEGTIDGSGEEWLQNNPPRRPRPAPTAGDAPTAPPPGPQTAGPRSRPPRPLSRAKHKKARHAHPQPHNP